MNAPAAVQRPTWLAATRLPASLGDLSIPPKGLWLLGDAAVLESAPTGHIAIVGTREASPYGERIATKLASAAARAGLVVVSGLARGIDAAAHRAAVAAGGKTVAVVGTGVDVPYPVGHRTLHQLVQENGAVLSEVEPGTSAKPGCFPRRNRIIAALAQVTVVVEAGFKSGAINTASQALDLGRTIAAVPGPIDDPRSAGANLLIRDGAQVITDVEDLLGLYGLSTKLAADTGSATDASRGDASQLGDEERRVLAGISAQATSIDDLAFALGLSVRQASATLLRLEMRGLIRQEGGVCRRA